MERTLKILAIGVITFLIIFWISTGFSKCGSDKKTEETITQDSLMNDEFPGSDEDIFDDVQEAENSDTTTAKPENKGENTEDYIDYTGAPKENAKPTKTKKAKSNKVNKTPTRATNSGYGSYFVVAGSYVVESNANKMKKRLSRLGYNSEVVVFDLSQYYTVLAGRFNTRSEASQVVRNLKAKRIDCYVQKKKN